MKLSLLIIVLALPMTGCVVHFPLDENTLTLQTQDSGADTGTSGTQQPNTEDPIKGNSPDTPY